MVKLAKALWVLWVLLFGISEATAATSARKVVIAYAPSSGELLLWIAKEQRFFDKYGLEAQVVLVKSTSTVISGLLSGDIQMGYTGGTGVVGAAPGGANLKIVASFFNKLIIRLIARPEIERTEDLKGKRLGVQSIGGANWMQSMLALEQLGLDPHRDNIRVLSSGSVRIQALETGSIDFTVVSDVSLVLMLKRNGFRMLAELPPTPFTSLGIVVERGYIQRHGDVVENVLKGLAEAAAFALSPERKGSTIELMTKHLNIRTEAAEERHKELTRILERKPYASIEGMQTIQRLMKVHNPQVAKIDVNRLIDSSIVQKLDQSGFLDRLYGAYGIK